MKEVDFLEKAIAAKEPSAIYIKLFIYSCGPCTFLMYIFQIIMIHIPSIRQDQILRISLQYKI